MRIEATLFALALLARPARAADVDARATLLLTGRQDVRDGRSHTIVPTYQLLSIVGRNLRAPGLEDTAIVVSAWGRVDPGEPRDDRTFDGDLVLAYAEGTLFDGSVAVRAGRQLVLGGVSRLAHLDGASVAVGSRGPFGVSAYLGAPTTPRFDVDRGDLLAGGRTFWRSSVETEVGASFVYGLDDGRVARQDAGVDARWAVHRSVVLSGYGAFSVPEERFSEIDLSASWRPLPELELTSGYQITAPDLFLPRTSVLSVFAEERRQQVGGTLYLAPIPRLDFDADYHAIVEDPGVGHDAGVRATVRPGGGLTGGVELRRLALDEGGFKEVRTWLLQRIGASLLLGVDLDLFFLDAPVRGERRSITLSGTIGYELDESWRAVLSAIGDATPFVERRFEGMLKVAYVFGGDDGESP